MMHTLVRARDLVPGTWLDLEGDPYADDGGIWVFEYAVVEGIQRGHGVVVVELTDGSLVDFPPDDQVRVVDPDEPVGVLEPDTVAESRGWK